MTFNSALPPMNILVADDNEANCLIARTILERAGHSIVTVENGLEALELSRIVSYDLIILDIMMPIMDGLVALQQIRETQTQNGTTPIFALTAYCDLEDRKRYAAAGFDAVLSKPLRRGDLYVAFSQYQPRGSKVVKQSLDKDKSDSIPLLDQDIISMLMVSGNSDRLSEIQSRFWTSTRTKCQTIKFSLPDALQGDGPQLSEFRRAVHAVKGASATIGLVRVAYICKELRNAPPEQIPALMIDLITALKASHPVLTKALSGTRELDAAVQMRR